MTRQLVLSASFLGLLAAGACAKDKHPSDEPRPAQEAPAPAATEKTPAAPPADDAKASAGASGATDTKKSPPPTGGDPAAVSHAGHRHEASDPYSCPMHPDESGKDKDATCPVCGMKLVPRK
jgi:hypothetical protein